MLGPFLQVAIGGAVGAMARYGVGLALSRWMGRAEVASIPLPILTVNVVGSFLMGVFVVVAAQRGLTHLSPLVMTGLLGGFTTFSAFSLETVTLIERGQVGIAGTYVLLSVGLSVLGLMVGLWLARAWIGG